MMEPGAAVAAEAEKVGVINVFMQVIASRMFHNCKKNKQACVLNK